ncbi:MAG: sensor histidine kinase [Granulosicoccus sp.]
MEFYQNSMMRQPAIAVLLQNFLFCTFIAFVLWQAVPSLGQYGFFNNFFHAQAIGNCIAIPALLAQHLFSHFQLTKRWLFLIIILIITPSGIYAGLALAGLFLDNPGAEQFHLLADTEQILITAGAAVIASAAFYWHWSSQEKVLRLELIASEESRRADTARHVMLQAQLEPHMLFNTLANLRALIGSDTDRAIEMLDRLDSFLRETLSSTQAAAHSLEHEFKVLEDYLALMQIRLGARLAYELHLPPECQRLMIPSLLLQPLVENAIRHGIEPKVEGGEIITRAQLVDNELVLIVEDTGVGIDKVQVTQTGQLTTLEKLTRRKPERRSFGLNNLNERLTQTYGNNVEISFESASTGASLKGTRVTLRIPVKELSETDGATMSTYSNKPLSTAQRWPMA